MTPDKDLRERAEAVYDRLWDRALVGQYPHEEQICILAAALAAERKDAEAECERYARALLSLTPGGSEFYHDPDRCVEFVRAARKAEHDAFVRLIGKHHRKRLLKETKE